MNKLAHDLLQSELDTWNLGMTEERPKFGRGLTNTRYIAEGEFVLNASCLWYDSKDKLMRFLEANPNEKDRVGVVRGVLNNSKPTTVYFVLVGAASFVNHFQGLRKTPNVKMVFDPSKGFNQGSLTYVVATKNRPISFGASRELWL